MKILLGKKIGMTTLIADSGKIEPVTVIEAGPCVVTQIKNQAQPSFQIGFGPTKKITKPLSGHLKGKKLKYLREFPLDEANTNIYQSDATVDLSIFDDQKTVDITGTSKGKGFAGGVKRHNFKIGPKSHGSKHHRRSGSTGCRFPQHTIKGHKMPGRMGNEQVTTKHLAILKIETDKNLLLVKGAVPGNKNKLIIIKQY